VAITSFRGPCDPSGTVSITTLSLTDAVTLCNISLFTCSRSGNTLHYSYHQYNGVDETVRGTATRP
jgi:hypothetical protein